MDENNKNVTKYGENVCSEFEWLSIENQKKNAQKLSNITKSKNKKIKIDKK